MIALSVDTNNKLTIVYPYVRAGHTWWLPKTLPGPLIFSEKAIEQRQTTSQTTAFHVQFVDWA